MNEDKIDAGETLYTVIPLDSGAVLQKMDEQSTTTSILDERGETADGIWVKITGEQGVGVRAALSEKRKVFISVKVWSEEIKEDLFK